MDDTEDIDDGCVASLGLCKYRYMCGWEVDTEIQESGWVAAVAGVAYLFWFPTVAGRWTQRYRRVGGLLL